jgi:hypothetical protein
MQFCFAETPVILHNRRVVNAVTILPILDSQSIPLNRLVQPVIAFVTCHPLEHLCPSCSHNACDTTIED